jgi:hypothetical protein
MDNTGRERSCQSAIRKRRSVVAKPRGTRPKARRRAAHDPPASGPKKRPCQAAPWRSGPCLERPGAAFKPEAPGNFLRLWRRDHLGSRRNHNVGAWFGQVGTLLGLRLFQWRGRTDHVRLGNGDRLLGLRGVRHDAIRTRGAAVRSGARRRLRILVVRGMPGAVFASPNSVFGPRWRSESGPCGLE